MSKIRIKGTNYMNGTNGVNVAKGANGTNGILGVIFDVDGTIHSGHSNELILRDNNGRSEQLAEIDGMFYRREIDADKYVKMVYPLFRGIKRQEMIDSFKHFKPFKGFKETIEAILKEGKHAILASCGPHIIVEQIMRNYGFHAAHGSHFIYDENEVCTGEVLRSNNEYTKRDFFVEYCAENGLDHKRFVGVGDSITDSKICLVVDTFIAINARDAFLNELDEIERQHPEKEIIRLQTTDLTDLLPHIIR